MPLSTLHSAPSAAADSGKAFRARPVVVEAAGLYTTAGATVADVLAAQAHGEPLTTRLPFASDWLPQNEAFLVDEPDLRASLYDRKAVRTMDKQARTTMAAALACGRNLEPFAEPGRVGLFLGMPTVEEPVPSWEALAELGPNPADRSAMLQTFLTSTPPMTGLLLLNSTAGSHVASQFGITGTTGVFSPWGDAGAEAVIEAAWSIVEGDNDRALAGGAAPTINPFLYLHYESQGLLTQGRDLPLPGEGAAFVALRSPSPNTPAEAACLTGYSRIFEPDPAQAAAARQRGMAEALERAGIAPADIDWILFDPHCGRCGTVAELAALNGLFGGLPVLGAWHRVCGHLGPAQPVFNLAVAEAALREGWRIATDVEGRFIERQSVPVRHILINASGFRGQFASLVISRHDYT
jgi:3-oxoacyl-[acyl-carrier-protein] synthase II